MKIKNNYIMKIFLISALTVIMFAACSKDAINKQQSIQNIVDKTPETLVVGFEDDMTRIQLNEDRRTIWTKGDCVSVFYRSDANQKWQYNGETGLRTGELECVDSGVETIKTSRIIIAYPYNENYGFDSATYSVATSMPATQTYMEDSFGLDGNIMVSSSESEQFTLKSVYGWVKLQLTGNGERVKSISLCGNDGEQVAGDVVINTPDATITLAADGDKSDATIFTEVTLDCGEGVELGAEATAFYIALPPQTYANGITVDIKAVDGSTMTKSTGKELVIERNHIQPMKAFVYEGIRPQPNTEIWYTNGSTTTATTPYHTDGFGDATIVSNTYDEDDEHWIIAFDREVTTIDMWTFYGCNMTSVTLPCGIISIGTRAFYSSAITTILIPESVTDIGSEAFYYCGNLKHVYCKPITPPTLGNVGSQMFYRNDPELKIYVQASDDDSILNAYKGAWSWRNYKNYIFEEE